MRRKLSEREAWLKLAEIFSNLDDSPPNGMCWEIGDLLDFRQITRKTYDTMERKIKATMGRLRRSSYLYSIDAAGHKKRVTYCKRKANELSRKSR